MLLKAVVTDEAGRPVYCRLTLFALEGGEAIETACCAGEHIFAVPYGAYRLEAQRGKLYYPAACTVQPGERSAYANLCLNRVVDPKALGLYSFDAHSHVSREDDSTAGSLPAAALVMKCEDFNFFFAGSPYDPDVHFQYLQRNFTDSLPYREKYAALIAKTRESDFILDIGNEIVKCRYGHAFMFNYDQRPPFSSYYDEQFDPWLFDKTGDEPGYDIAYMHEALLREKEPNSVAVAAHPTSWWWHDNGEFITNIAATIGFEVLAGSIDAMVVLGYGDDKPFYQALWYDLLKNGCFLPGVAETDVAFDRRPGGFLRFKTYCWLDEFSVDALCGAVRAGRCMVSSGPLIIMRVDGQLPGSVLPYLPGQEFTVDVECIACCDGPVTEIQLLLSGDVVAEYAVRGEKCSIQHKINIADKGFVIAKCRDAAGNAAIANPVYIRNEPFVNSDYFASVHIEASAGGEPAKGYWRLDDGERMPFDAQFSLKMRPASVLQIEAAGKIKTVKLFELDELQRMFKNLYMGRFNRDRQLNPGEVPAEEFRVRQIREFLDDVRLRLDL